MKARHEQIKNHFQSLKRVEKVFNVLETPNRYGANVSNFTVKYDHIIKGGYESTTRIDFSVEWDRNILFIANKGYFPFKSVEDILTTITNNL